MGYDLNKRAELNEKSRGERLADYRARIAELEAERDRLREALEAVIGWRKAPDPSIDAELAKLHEEMETCPECAAMKNHPVSRGVCAGGKYRHYERTHAFYERRDEIMDSHTPWEVQQIARQAL